MINDFATLALARERFRSGEKLRSFAILITRAHDVRGKTTENWFLRLLNVYLPTFCSSQNKI